MRCLLRNLGVLARRSPRRGGLVVWTLSLAQALVPTLAVLSCGNRGNSPRVAGAWLCAPQVEADRPMVSIPGGTFRMGSLYGEGAANEYPQHLVKVNAFEIDANDVTVFQFDA